VEISKILKGFSWVDSDIWFNYLIRDDGVQTRLTADNLALKTQRPRLDSRKYSFSARAVTPPLNLLQKESRKPPSTKFSEKALLTNVTQGKLPNKKFSIPKIHKKHLKSHFIKQQQVWTISLTRMGLMIWLGAHLQA
jgi:hypothetical protein